jgi:hypothetical protein
VPSFRVALGTGHKAWYRGTAYLLARSVKLSALRLNQLAKWSKMSDECTRPPMEASPEGWAEGRRAIMRALAGAPVILTIRSALAQTISEPGPSLGNPNPACSNIRDTPADQVPPFCRR